MIQQNKAIKLLIIVVIILSFAPIVASAAPFAYITNYGSNNVSVIDTSTNTVTANVTVGTGPYGVAVNPAGTHVYVANYDSNNVSVINTSTNTVTDNVTVGTKPFGVAVNPAGTRVYVANEGSNNVSVINTSTNTVTDTIIVGTRPYAFGIFITPEGASDTTPPAPASLTTDTGNYWVNYTWTPGDADSTDGYNVSIGDGWANTTNTSYNYTDLGPSGWANITVWAWNATGDGNMSDDNKSDQVQAPAAPTDTTPPAPASLTTDTGNYWVNYTWTPGDADSTDGYNVSTDVGWANTTNTSYNYTDLSPSEWTNITVWAWNATGDGNMSVTNVSDNVQAPAGTTPPVPTDLQNTTGTDWVNFTWTVGDGIVTDGYNVSMNSGWDNTTNTFLNSTVGAGNWSNITVWSWNATGDGNMSVTNVSDNVQAPAAPTGTTPPIPTDLQNTTGTDWVNFTWTVGDGIVTDGYNVSMNSGWDNTTNTFLNSTVGAGNWSNITVWAWNATGDGNMSATNVSDTVQAPAAILQRINITETSQTLNISESMTFNATGYDYTNAIYPSNITFTWYTTPSGIGTLNATTGSVVNFTALHAGRTEIYAVNGSISSNATDSVWITVNAITNTTEVSGGNATATSGDSTAIVNLTNSTVTGTINFTEMGDPVNSSVVNGSTTGLGTNVKLIKGVDVNVSKNITKALAIDTSGNSYVYIRIDYNQSQIDGLGIDENTLYIYKFVNGTGWVKLVQGNPSYCIANGRNTTADYIWVNVTNCSTFLLAGTPTAEPTPPRSSSGGGGGGGVGTSDEPENVEETVFLRIYLRAGDSSTYNFNNLVTSVEVTPTRTYGLLGAKMEVLYGQPGSITTDPPSGESYKYFNVFFARTSGSGDKFSSSVINFQVPESWFKENNIDPATVTLYRYNDDGWKPLTTTMTGQAGGNYQYSAPTPGFSTFVIMGQVNESSSVEPVATEDSGTVADSTPTEEATTKGTPGFGILVGIMGILVAVYSRKK